MELLKVAHVRLHINSGLGWEEADLKIFNTWNALDILSLEKEELSIKYDDIDTFPQDLTRFLTKFLFDLFSKGNVK